MNENVKKVELSVLKPSEVKDTGTYLAIHVNDVPPEELAHPATRCVVLDVWRNANGQMIWRHNTRCTFHTFDSSVYKDDHYVLMGPIGEPLGSSPAAE